jgi:hypothetical protein
LPSGTTKFPLIVSPSEVNSVERISTMLHRLFRGLIKHFPKKSN